MVEGRMAPSYSLCSVPDDYTDYKPPVKNDELLTPGSVSNNDIRPNVTNKSMDINDNFNSSDRLPP